MPSAGRIALAAVLVAGTGAGATDVVRPASYRLPPLLAQLFAAGRTQFEAVETPASGLGPVFNATSCAACHARPTSGGSSAVSVTRFGRDGPGGFDPMADEGGPVVEEKGIVTDTCAVPGETVPPDATIVTKRNTPPLFGLGLVDTIPDRAILHLARSVPRPDGVIGRPNLVHGRVGRFGWKAQVVTLRQFTASAYLNELGVTSPDFPSDLPPQGRVVLCDPAADPEDDGTRIDAVTRFLLLLAPPPMVTGIPAVGAGRIAFREAGCETCHTTRLRVGPTHPLAAVRGRRIPMFSDLLLHDMGSALADGIAQGFATGADFRTPPLWGVRDSAPYLHDGRAATLQDAIALHGGEGELARQRFLALPADRQAALLAFLRVI